jgi:uncharacterized membrane protein
MSELTLALVAAACAGAMVVLVRAGANPDLRATLRTTMVLVVGWSLAWRAHPAASLHSLSKRTWILLVLSCLAAATSWTLYFRRARQPGAGGVLSIDQVNIGFAILFAITLFVGQANSQSWLSGLLIVTAAFILARR